MDNSLHLTLHRIKSYFDLPHSLLTHYDYEIIVVDDGSTDNTKDVIKPYLDRINYIYKENGGQGSARNAGIMASRGECIAFLDSDDLWLPEKLKIQMDYLERNKDIGIVFSNLGVFRDNTNWKEEEIKCRTKPMEILAGESSAYRLLCLIALKMGLSWRSVPINKPLKLQTLHNYLHKIVDSTFCRTLYQYIKL